MPRTGVFELPDLGVEAGGALVGCEEVGLQRCARHGWTSRLPCGGRGGFESVDLLERIVVPVEVGAVDALLTEQAQGVSPVQQVPTISYFPSGAIT